MKYRLLYLATSRGLTIEQSGGAGTHIRGTLAGLDENGFEVLALLGGNVFPLSKPNRSIELNEKISRMGKVREVIKGVLPNKIRLLLRDIRTVLQDYQFEHATSNRIKDFAPQAIYERSSYLSLAGLRLSKKLNIPYLIETDGRMVEIINNDYGVFSVYIGNLFERKKLNSANYIVVMNRSATEIISRKFNLNNPRFLVKTLGIEDSNFMGNMLKARKLRDNLNIQDRFVVGFVGAISSYHGVQYLIDAAEYLFRTGEDKILIIIIGWSKEGERLKRRVEEEGILNVLFTGKVNKEEIADYYSLMDVGVIPDADPIMYPIKVLEYGIFSLPPLVPNYKVFEDIIIDNFNGYFFEMRNAESLADCIVRLSHQRDECSRVGRQWKENVSENFKWKDTVREVVNALRNIPK